MKKKVKKVASDSAVKKNIAKPINAFFLTKNPDGDVFNKVVDSSFFY